MKLGRNEPCNCGSGKKYKNCCQGKLVSPATNSSSLTSANLASLDALFFAGQYAELERGASVLLKLHPDAGGVWKLLGISLQMQGKDALPAMQRAAELLPYDAETYANLSALLRSRGQLEAAVASGQRALQIKPDFPEAHNNQGVALKELGQFEAALFHYRKAVELKPDFAEAHNNFGITLKELGQLDNAVASYRRALKIKPDFVDAHNNLGNALVSARKLDEAIISYRKAVELNPDFHIAQGNLLSILNYAIDPRDFCLDDAKQYGRMVAQKVASKFVSWQCTRQPKRLRIGFVSGTLRNNPTGFFLESILSQLDSKSVELFAYSTNPKVDELTARIKPYFIEWKSLVGKSDEEAAHLIHGDGVHILIDLAGHSAHNRLPVFAWKPAPVQVSWLDYYGTTGVAEIDYLLVDRYVTPDGEERNFTETLWRLPDSYLCFTEPAYSIDVSPLPVLSTGCITFGSFNKLDKMNDTVIDLWSRILLAVPNSRLFLKTPQLGDSLTRKNTQLQFAERGVPSTQLLLEGGASRADLLSAYHKVDITLDPFPYPGGTTSMESLWMGVPLITLCGKSFLSRIGESICYNAGLPDWIATNENHYLSKAAEYAADTTRLAKLRSGLREQVLSSPIFDAPRFARKLEATVWEMWQKHQLTQ